MDRKKIIERVVIAIIILMVASTIIKTVRKNMQAVEVKVIKVEKGQLSNDIIYSGVVTPGEVTPIYVDASGIIEDVYVRVGDEIKKGDVLISFSNQSIIENEKILKVNELDIKNVELQIQDQESGSMKLELDNRQLEIKNLEEQIKADQRRLPVLTEEARIAKKKAEAYMQLLSKDGVSATEASAMTTAANKAEVALEDLKTTLTLNKEKYQLMFVSYESLKRELDINRAQLDSQLEKLKLENETLKLRDKQLREPFISPVSGVIAKIDTAPGANVSPGQRVFSIATSGSTKVVLELPVYQVESIKKGQPAQVISKDGEEEKKYKGIVEKVSAAAVSSSYGKNKVIAVEVLVTEPNDLRPGFLADVELSGKGKSGVPLLNSFSIVTENDGYYVYINDYGVAKKRKIEVGLKSSNYYEVLDLPEDVEVIVNPHKVSDGKKIKVIN